MRDSQIQAGDYAPGQRDTRLCGHLVDEALKLDIHSMRSFERMLSRANDKQEHRYQGELNRLRQGLDEREAADVSPPPGCHHHHHIHTEGGTAFIGRAREREFFLTTSTNNRPTWRTHGNSR